jgi:hypothetical protein
MTRSRSSHSLLLEIGNGLLAIIGCRRSRAKARSLWIGVDTKEKGLHGCPISAVEPFGRARGGGRRGSEWPANRAPGRGQRCGCLRQEALTGQTGVRPSISASALLLRASHMKPCTRDPSSRTRVSRRSGRGTPLSVLLSVLFVRSRVRVLSRIVTDPSGACERRDARAPPHTGHATDGPHGRDPGAVGAHGDVPPDRADQPPAVLGAVRVLIRPERIIGVRRLRLVRKPDPRAVVRRGPSRTSRAYRERQARRSVTCCFTAPSPAIVRSLPACLAQPNEAEEVEFV